MTLLAGKFGRWWGIGHVSILGRLSRRLFERRGALDLLGQRSVPLRTSRGGVVYAGRGGADDGIGALGGRWKLRLWNYDFGNGTEG